MRALIQRVKRAEVRVDNRVVGKIQTGLLVFVGVEDADGVEDLRWLSQKITQLRIFADEHGVMNRSLLEIEGDILLVSQFTLHAATKKGNRPSYIRASKPDVAIPLYEAMIQALTEIMGRPIQTGVFGADMEVDLINDGPVTIWMDTKEKE